MVILYKQDHTNKLADILNNTNKFKVLDKTVPEEQRIQRKLIEFYNEHLLPKNIYEIIRPGGSNKTIVWTP